MAHLLQPRAARLMQRTPTLATLLDHQTTVFRTQLHASTTAYARPNVVAGAAALAVSGLWLGRRARSSN